MADDNAHETNSQTQVNDNQNNAENNELAMQHNHTQQHCTEHTIQQGRINKQT